MDSEFEPEFASVAESVVAVEVDVVGGPDKEDEEEEEEEEELEGP